MWTEKLSGRLFSFGDNQHTAIFLEDCDTLDEDSIWLTDILVNGIVCKAVINWDRLINNIRDPSEYNRLNGPCMVQMYIPNYEWERGFDDVSLL